jgi:hypothetical protein
MDRTCSMHLDMINVSKILLEILKVRDISEDLDIDGRIISKWMLRN